MGTLREVYRGTSSIDFPRAWRVSRLVSAVLVLASVASLVTGGLNLGIDFEGGVALEVTAPGVSAEEARDAMAAHGEGRAKIQTIGSDLLRVQTGAHTSEDTDAIRTTLAELAGTSVDSVSVSVVGPSWGDEITDAAIKALVWVLIAISFYIAVRLEWRMAVGAFVALVHDVLATVGVYAVFDLEVTPSTVIAFLTILGYSLYDTIVVYDKVHEIQARSRGRETYDLMMSRAMNAVLLRSINTTVTSLLPVVSMLVVGAGIMGAVTLRDFSMALLIGMLVGAYSSMFVAAPVVASLYRRTPEEVSKRARADRAGRSDRVSGAATTYPDVDAATNVESQIPAQPEVFSTGHPPRPRKQGKRR